MWFTDTARNPFAPWAGDNDVRSADALTAAAPIPTADAAAPTTAKLLINCRRVIFPRSKSSSSLAIRFSMWSPWLLEIRRHRRRLTQAPTGIRANRWAFGSSTFLIDESASHRYTSLFPWRASISRNRRELSRRTEAVDLV